MKNHFFGYLPHETSITASEASYQSNLVSGQLSAISYQLKAVSYQLSAFSRSAVVSIFHGARAGKRRAVGALFFMLAES
jgi:hypothetical protein